MPMPVEMRETEIPAVLEFIPKVFSDARGFFTETYNRDTWTEKGFHEDFIQDNLSLSCKGTLRGLHYQIEPQPMGKLVRAIRGAVFDVAVDLREGSPTFGKYVGRELNADNGIMLWVPVGFAHGFVALEDDTMVYYKCTGTHCPETERALNYQDPDIGIDWPIEATVVTEKDANAPMLGEAEYNFRYEA
jgi:dTDP-4-dehydrorhamnose 3,5-epimerase